MTCDSARQLLHAYLDDELDVATALQIETHLRDCTQCQADAEQIRLIRAAAQKTDLYYPAPAELRKKLSSQFHLAGETNSRLTSYFKRNLTISWPFSGLAALLILGIGVAIIFAPVVPPARGRDLDEVVSSHIRSLQANHLLDVESTDQHTVKPWFAGKIDFSPPVNDLAAKGFPLIGGRLDYFNQQKVAALIYRRNKHIINVFIYPGNTSPRNATQQGYNLIRFECKAMACCAVSDLNANELQHFVDLFRSPPPATTRN